MERALAAPDNEAPVPMNWSTTFIVDDQIFTMRYSDMRAVQAALQKQGVDSPTNRQIIEAAEGTESARFTRHDGNAIHITFAKEQ